MQKAIGYSDAAQEAWAVMRMWNKHCIWPSALFTTEPSGAWSCRVWASTSQSVQGRPAQLRCCPAEAAFSISARLRISLNVALSGFTPFVRLSVSVTLPPGGFSPLGEATVALSAGREPAHHGTRQSHLDLQAVGSSCGKIK